jgi:hypothetical protein
LAPTQGLAQGAKFGGSVQKRVRHVDCDDLGGLTPNCEIARIVADVVEAFAAESIDKRGRLGWPFEVPLLVRAYDLIEQGEVAGYGVRDAGVGGGGE